MTDQETETTTQARPTVSTRDLHDTHQRLGRWLAGRLPAASELRLSELRQPEGSGMSSETLLFEAEWREDGATRHASLVARMAPEPGTVPVFPRYDMDRQFQVLDLVRRRTGVPVPTARFYEGDVSVLGAPFFVMDRVEGLVPADIPSYNMAGWVFEATPEQRRRLESTSLARLAELHQLDGAAAELAFVGPDTPGDSALRRHVADQEAYYRWTTADGIRSPLLERTFRWLEDHWPDESPAVLSWGDARIGNIMYRDFEPVALLDWEMVATAPAEVDVGWMIILHQFFEGIAGMLELPGLPDLLDRDQVAAGYEAASGRHLRNLEWYEVYAALRHGIVMFRIGRRSVHFGEAEMPEDPETFITHRDLLERMLEGSYWKDR